MKHRFPQKLFWVPFGWEDWGKVRSTASLINGEVFASQMVCGLCSTIMHVGIEWEDDTAFLFCPKCLTKDNPPKRSV